MRHWNLSNKNDFIDLIENYDFIWKQNWGDEGPFERAIIRLGGGHDIYHIYYNYKYPYPYPNQIFNEDKEKVKHNPDSFKNSYGLGVVILLSIFLLFFFSETANAGKYTKIPLSLVVKDASVKRDNYYRLWLLTSQFGERSYVLV